MLRHLAHRNAKVGPTLRLTGSASTAEDLLRALLHSAGLGTPQSGLVALRHLLDAFLSGQQTLGSRVHLAIDDADRLGADAWREVERIVSPHGNGPAPVLLLGLTAIADSRAPAAVYVRGQTAPVIARLSWLDASELAGYLEWRFSRFGLAGINTPSATRLLARCSRGCFAAIDHLCQVALLLLRQGNGSQLNITLVREAADQVQKRRRLGQQNQPGRDRKPSASIVSEGIRKNAAIR